MNTHSTSTRTWVAVVAIVHLVVCLVHGAAHARAQIPMSQAANIFVFVVILAGPMLGLSLLWRVERAAGWVIATTLAASFVFGVVNHFLLIGPDHVAHVVHHVRPAFTMTAGLLALTEAVGAGMAARLVRLF